MNLKLSLLFLPGWSVSLNVLKQPRRKQPQNSEYNFVLKVLLFWLVEKDKNWKRESVRFFFENYEKSTHYKLS
jgi:hypothetical protein